MRRTRLYSALLRFPSPRSDACSYRKNTPSLPARKRIARRVVIRRHFFDVPEIVVFVEIRLIQRSVVLADQAVDVVIRIPNLFSAGRPAYYIPVRIVFIFVCEVQSSEFHFRDAFPRPIYFT